VTQSPWVVFTAVCRRLLYANSLLLGIISMPPVAQSMPSSNDTHLQEKFPSTVSTFTLDCDCSCVYSYPTMVYRLVNTDFSGNCLIPPALTVFVLPRRAFAAQEHILCIPQIKILLSHICIHLCLCLLNLMLNPVCQATHRDYLLQVLRELTNLPLPGSPVLTLLYFDNAPHNIPCQSPTRPSG